MLWELIVGVWCVALNVIFLDVGRASHIHRMSDMMELFIMRKPSRSHVDIFCKQKTNKRKCTPKYDKKQRFVNMLPAYIFPCKNMPDLNFFHTQIPYTVYLVDEQNNILLIWPSGLPTCLTMSRHLDKASDKPIKHYRSINLTDHSTKPGLGRNWKSVHHRPHGCLNQHYHAVSPITARGRSQHRARNGAGHLNASA